MTVQVGFCALPLTPAVDMPMAGFAARTQPSSGVHDEIYVRAMVVSDAQPDAVPTALVVADLVSLPPAQTDEIRAEIARTVGIPASAVIVATTHTHGGPATDERTEASPLVSEYASCVRRIVVQAVEAAAAQRHPARMLLGFGNEPTVGKNRRRAGGVVDPAVPTIRVEDADGRVVGIVCCYACHPVTLGPDNRLITADYPGAVVRTLEAVYPGAVAMFVTGCAGQINTGHSATASLSVGPSEFRSFREMSRLGTAIAGAAIQTSEQIAGPRGTPSAVAPGTSPASAVRAVTVAVAAPRLPSGDAASFRELASNWQRRLAELPPDDADAQVESDQLNRWVGWADRMAAGAPHADVVPLDVTALRWGDIVVVGLPGEPFVEFGLEIRERAPVPVVVAGYANGCPGYVPHRSAYDEGGYEVLHAHRVYGAPAAFAPEAGEQLVEAALAAIDELGPFRDEQER